MKGKLGLTLSVLSIVAGLVLAGCAPLQQTNVQKEAAQQATGISTLLNNQPVPDLGGWSFERQVVIDTYVARNKMVNTYTYLFMEYTGKIVKICDSKGYPIPYSTELTNPTQAYGGSYGYTSIGNPEPTGLYPPASAAATLVQCVMGDGQVVPTYWENNVFALPYEIQADMVLTPTGKAPSFSVGVK